MAQERLNRLKAEAIARRSARKVSLEEIFAQAQAGDLKELNIVLKSDVSGSLEAHYAPLTPMRLVATPQLPAVIAELQKSGRRCALLAHTRQALLALPHEQHLLPDDAEAYAHGLYAALRELDRSGNEVIVVEDVPADPAWAAVSDRLRRAACGSGEV